MRTREEIKGLLNKVIAAIPGLEAQASYSFEKTIATRLGENAITQNTGGEEERIRLVVYNGKRSGSSITNKMDDDSLGNLVRVSVQMAEESPEDPEYVELPGPQKYNEMQKAFFEDTERLTPEQIAEVVDSCHA